MAVSHSAPISAFYVLCMLAVLACVPATAAAATPPVLRSPATATTSFVEGDSMTFKWTGTLQGDPDTLTRAYFRLEISDAADVPAGAQTEWTKLENYVVTEPGEEVVTATLGVPAAGSYRWRVCIWGVVDDLVANEIQQLPDGCSATRTFSSKAAAADRGTIGELKIEEKSQVSGEVRRVYVTRPGTTAPTPTRPVAPVTSPEPVVQEQPTEEVLADAVFEPLTGLKAGGNGASSVDLGSRGLTAETASSRQGMAGAISSALGMTLPFLGIPLWVLALLLICVPIARMWRSSVLGMFDWPDGSVNGLGDMSNMPEDAAIVQLASSFKDGSSTADGAAPAPANTPSAPDRGRRSA